jgi:hypothetical protein
MADELQPNDSLYWRLHALKVCPDCLSQHAQGECSDAAALQRIMEVGKENLTKHPVKINSLDGGEM